MFNKNYQLLTNRARVKRHAWSAVSCILLCALLAGFFNGTAAAHSLPAPVSDGLEDNFAALESQLESIRQVLKIPGMSAAVVKDQELVWAAGFGYADLENQIPATPDTPYELASVTKPVAAVIIMQLVEAGLVDLDVPLSQYGVDMFGGDVTVRHLLTHTSEGIPGEVHDYNGNRFARLGGVIEGASGKTFATLLSENILLPLGMENTALNPFNNWGGPKKDPLEDFARTLGWGADFRTYPDVYARLAKPYQFDSQHNIIPGMFFLYHNPGAGLISSVTDLAKFDVALDQGVLIGASYKAEMLSPAVSTYNNRRDLNYGLGWYVQEFEGLRLLWHSGRWEPSSSALYLKIPELRLTFIVLANTDNLTVPFAGIGNGDITKSSFFLAFFRNLVFSAENGAALPAIDWSASEGDLVTLLAAVEDKAARKFLERELWSYRQAFARSGQSDQVEKLNHVRLRAFSKSLFGSDPFITTIAGLNPAVPTAVHAGTLAQVTKAIAIWICLLLISTVWMCATLLFSRGIAGWVRLLWVLSALLLGPAAVLIYRASRRSQDGNQSSSWTQAWRASALMVPVYAAAWSLALTLLMQVGYSPHPLMILGASYFVPLLVVIVLVRIPLQYRGASENLWRKLTHGLLADITTNNLAYAVFFPLVMLFSERVLTTLPHPSSPFFWGMITWAALAALVTQIPLQRWLSQRGYALYSDQDQADASQGSLKPALAGTLVLIVLSLAFTISQSG